jgi:hypothetical protein
MTQSKSSDCDTLPALALQVRTERRHYHQHRELAQAYPDKYVSIIIDGMDQNKTRLPKHKRTTDRDNNKAELRTHLIGALVHGTPVPAYVFTAFDEWPADTNLNLQCLLLILQDVGLENLKGKTLFLQMDNTVRENKNYTLLTFMALLKRLNIFKAIEISYLPVGHTHEDVDQMFGCISRVLKNAKCGSVEAMHDIVRAAYTPAPKCIHIDVVGDFRSWLKPYFPDTALHNITVPQCFRLASKPKQAACPSVSPADTMNDPTHVAHLAVAAEDRFVPVFTRPDLPAGPEADRVADDAIRPVCLQFKLWSRHNYWLPKTDGLQVLKPIKAPTKPPRVVTRRIIATQPIREYYELCRNRINEDHFAQAMGALDAIDERQQRMCVTCKQLRFAESHCKRHKTASAEERREGNRERNQVRPHARHP